jgi:hypothetical protein
MNGSDTDFVPPSKLRPGQDHRDELELEKA